MSRAQVDAALAYASDYGAEIDARIDLHRSATAAVSTLTSRLLLGAMYPASLADALGERGVEAVTAVQLGLGGRPDADVLEAAVTAGRALLTEDVAGFAALSADWLLEGRHHPGILIALSSRFSRRPGGRSALADAVAAVRDDHLSDRVIYLVVSQ